MKEITPELLARPNTEAAHQTALFCWAAQAVAQYPALRWLHHIPNGGKRDKVIAGKMKAQGVKTGVADLCLPVRCGHWSGLYIEMKAPAEKPKNPEAKGGLSDAQIEFKTFVLSQGFGFAVCYSWIEARDVIISYLNWKG